MTAPGTPDEVAARLYGLELAEFTPARDEAAKALRTEKRRDEAAEVAALRKPSTAAWIVNRLAREHADAVAELLAAGDALRQAQDKATAGKDRRGRLREAGERERHALDALMAAAKPLRPDGRAPSEAVLERVRATLRAAATDADVRAGIAAGRLVREADTAGAWPL